MLQYRQLLFTQTVCQNKKLLGALVCLSLILVVVVPLVVFLIRGYSYTTKGAIVSNGEPCAEIGMKILRKYENAVDATIATMLCDGVSTLHNMGIGGGFVTTIYIRKEGKAYTMNAREVAPSRATQDMYKFNQTFSTTGGLSVAVPGELMGYWEMYNKFGGKAPWKELFQPTIDLCKNGVPININVVNAIERVKESIKRNKGLAELLKNEKGELPKVNDKIKMLKLAETLERVAEKGPSVLYNGPLSKPLIDDIQKNNGILTVEDLANYSVRWEAPVEVNLTGSLKMYSVPAPSSGPILSFLFRILDGFIPAKDEPTDVGIITEAFKFGYAQRTHLGDPYFVNISEALDRLKDPSVVNKTKSKLEVSKTSTDPKYYGADYDLVDHGTANIAVLAPNGDAVSATSTVNLLFGSGVVSESTGIILNDEMDDFSSPGIINAFGVSPSPNNFIRPGARPVSSMCPSIFVDKKGDVRLVIGGSGGTIITTSTAQVAVNNLWLGKDIMESVKAPRFHHQLFPMEWVYESSMPKAIVDKMISFGHTVISKTKLASCVSAISKEGDIIKGSTDFRRPGGVAYVVPPKLFPFL